MKKLIKLAVVQDKSMPHNALISLLEKLSDKVVTTKFSYSNDLIENLDKNKIDVILLNLETSIVIEREMVEYLHKRYPKIKILTLIPINCDESILLNLIENGAHGFILKNDCIEIISHAIHTVIERGYYFSDTVTIALVKSLKKVERKTSYIESNALSEREIEIIKLICEELTNKEIASKLFISTRTVEGHREKILHKTKAKNTVGIVRYALKNNFLSLL